MKKKIMFIHDKDIKQALKTITKQYLVGNVSHRQELVHIADNKIEIGITSYSGYATEAPYYHTHSYQYHYMISGMTEYIEIETNEVMRFCKGDFYVIPPEVAYAQRSKPGTTVLFINFPSGNDKVNIGISDSVDVWLQKKIKTIRTDYTNQPNAPKPNSIKPAVAVAIINDNDEILLLQRQDNGKWAMPGGTLELGEDLVTCAIREVHEETGYSIEITDIIGTYSSPNTVIQYSDGEVRQEFAIVYSGRIAGGNIQLDEESSRFQWVSLENVGTLTLADSQRKRLQDVIEFHKYGKRFLC